MRFCTTGMWGIGTYFATNANYSYPSYCFKLNNCSQMFVVKVLVGDYYECPADNSIRMPPPKPKGKSDLGFETERYDCCRGVASGSMNYVLYEPHRAYPFYLITFTHN